MAHYTTFRVYYEDTDAGGVVYYANYLKFAERARTEWLRDFGVNQSTLDYFLVVRHVMLDLKKPARLDDILTIQTTMIQQKAASLEMEQIIQCETNMLAVIRVKIACVDKHFKPQRWPELLQKLEFISEVE